MRLLGFRWGGDSFIGAVSEGVVQPLSPMDEFYADGCQTGDAGHELLDLRAVEQIPPVPQTARVFCVGVNYASHAEEAKIITGNDAPARPMIFGRWPSTLVVDGAPVPTPPNEGLDWEVELAAVIGQYVWCADEEHALDSVLGYTAFNDLSARHKQLMTSQFTLGKNADRSGPIGPVVVTPDEIGDADSLRLRTWVNGQVVQDANTAHMVHSLAEIIAFITDTVSLRPGDVIATGTPGGVALGNPSRCYLAPGDVVEVEIERIGRMRTPIVDRADLDPALLR